MSDRDGELWDEDPTEMPPEDLEDESVAPEEPPSVWNRTIEGVVRYVIPELKLALGYALSIALALAVKRQVDHMIKGGVVDKGVIERGGLSPTPGQPLRPTPSPSQESLYNQYRTNLDHPASWDPKYKWYTGQGGHMRRLEYRESYKTPDGYQVYEHDEMIRQDHIEGNCPMLKVDTCCQDCQWYKSRTLYARDSRCAAKVWLEEGHSPALTLRSVYEMM